MGDWPSQFVGSQQNNVVGFWNTVGLNATLNTKSTWTELVSSTPFDCHIAIAFTGSNVGDYLYDIGVGASGSEVVRFQDLFKSVGNTNSSYASDYLFIPILIPKGSRVAFRTAKNVASPTVQCFGYMVPTSSWNRCTCFQNIYPFGATSADSGGISINPGTGGISVKGSWTQMATSGAMSRKANGIVLSIGSQGNGSRATQRWYVDVGITSDPTNNIIISDYPITTNASTDTVYPQTSQVIPCSIAPGTEIHARASCTITTGDTFDLVLHCLM